MRFANVLQEHERETRLSLARYARKASKDAESANLRDTPIVHKLTQTAGLVHGWNEGKGSETILNLAVLTGQEQPVRLKPSSQGSE